MAAFQAQSEQPNSLNANPNQTSGPSAVPQPNFPSQQINSTNVGLKRKAPDSQHTDIPHKLPTWLQQPEQQGQNLFCEICIVQLNSVSQALQHKQGKLHLNKAKKVEQFRTVSLAWKTKNHWKLTFTLFNVQVQLWLLVNFHRTQKMPPVISGILNASVVILRSIVSRGDYVRSTVGIYIFYNDNSFFSVIGARVSWSGVEYFAVKHELHTCSLLLGIKSHNIYLCCEIMSLYLLKTLGKIVAKKFMSFRFLNRSDDIHVTLHTKTRIRYCYGILQLFFKPLAVVFIVINI